VIPSLLIKDLVNGLDVTIEELTNHAASRVCDPD